MILPRTRKDFQNLLKMEVTQTRTTGNIMDSRRIFRCILASISGKYGPY